MLICTSVHLLCFPPLPMNTLYMFLAKATHVPVHQIQSLTSLSKSVLEFSLFLLHRFFLFTESVSSSYKHTVTFILIKKPTYSNLICPLRYYCTSSFQGKLLQRLIIFTTSTHSPPILTWTHSSKAFCSQCFMEHELIKVSSEVNVAKFSGRFSVLILLDYQLHLI